MSNSNIHIVLVTHGSRGDTQPIVVMGLALQKLNYNVSLIGLGDQKQFAERYGIKNYIGMTTTARELFEEAKTFVCGTFNLDDFLSSFEENKKIRYPRESNEILNICKTADFIIYHPSVEGQIWSISEKYNIPSMQFLLVPWRPTKEFPPPLYSENDFPKPEDNLSSWDNNFIKIQSTYINHLNEWRKNSLDLPPIDFSTNNYKSIAHYIQSKTPFITCFSSEILPIPKDWDSNLLYKGGYLFMDNKDPSGWEPSKQLKDFLDPSLDEPIYIGFGSMIHKEPEKLLSIIFESIKNSNCRAIICEGWFTLKKPDDFTPKKYGFNNNQILFVTDIPHTWLLPKCSLSIIHGGAGTTAAAVLAQKPVIICPFLVDQPFWSLACKKAGISPQINGLSASTITSELLTKIIHEALTNEDIKNNAKIKGQNLAKENGINIITDKLQEYINTNIKKI